MVFKRKKSESNANTVQPPDIQINVDPPSDNEENPGSNNNHGDQVDGKVHGGADTHEPEIISVVSTPVESSQQGSTTGDEEQQPYRKASAKEENMDNNARLKTNNFDSLKRITSKSSILSTMDNVKGKIGVPKVAKSEKTRINFVVGFFFLCCVLFISTSHYIHYKHLGELRLFGHLKLEEADRTLQIFDRKDNLLIKSHIGVSLPHHMHPYPCIDPSQPSYASYSNLEERCLEWKDLAKLIIKEKKMPEGIYCYSLYWQALSAGVSPTDCFPGGLNSGHWYGGGESLKASWPLENGKVSMSAFVTGDEGQTAWGNIIKKYFLNSRGVSLTIDDHTPLLVSINEPEDQGLCIQAKFDDFAYFYHRYDLPRLNYTVCTSDNDLNKLHEAYLPDSFWDGHSQQDLNTLHNLLQKPVWQIPSFTDLSYEKIKKYINSILKSQGGRMGDDMGYLLLNYHWQKHMGDFTFNEDAFPNLEETLELVKRSGFQLVLTINPFVSTESLYFKDGVDEELFVIERGASRNVPALTWFKDVTSAGLLDITYNKTVDWLKRKLKKLDKKLENSGTMFFVDSGNTFHTPTYFQFKKPMYNPDLYRDQFFTKVMEEVPVIGVSAAASKRPKAPAFVFLSPLAATWSHMQSIIPNVLQLSIIGYPFINPGAVGGTANLHEMEAVINAENNSPFSAYNNASRDAIKAKEDEDVELFVRWWQLNTFMPMLNFYKPPGAFKGEVIQTVSQKLKVIRDDTVVPNLVKFSNQAMKSSTPVIRPLWMIDPWDLITHEINDQFAIGDSVLVAPVLNKGVRIRDVYLPNLRTDKDSEPEETVWKKGSDGTFYRGGRWLNDTRVQLDEVLYFIRQEAGDRPKIGL